TFSTSINAYHLSYDPTHTKMIVNKAAENFSLPDLHPTVSDHLDQVDVHVNHSAVGGRCCAHPGCLLLFEHIQVWCKIWTQSQSFHDPAQLESSQTLYTQPSSSAWPYGRYDSVIVSTGNMHKWPKSGLDRHFFAYLHLIFHPIMTLLYFKTYFAYVEYLNVVTLNNSTGMYILRLNNDWIGNVIPITQIVAPVHLILHFDPKANPQLTIQSSINHAIEFYLNKFWNKELFFMLHVTGR
ncbi:hypothetical protein CY34DRAFT_95540, partial [Suillus luteus UH-Slu-Lm8-n1]